MKEKDSKKKELTKEQKIEQVMNKYMVQRKIYFAGLISVIASMIVTVGGLVVAAPASIVYANNNAKINAQVEELAKDSTDYHAYINQNTVDLYNKLQNGEITPKEFSEMYSDLISDEKTLEWARESDNAEIQEIVKQYDGKVQKAKGVAIAGLKAIFGGMVATVGVGVPAGIIEKVSNGTLEEYKQLTAKPDDEKEA